jgi:hypothetical protein
LKFEPQLTVGGANPIIGLAVSGPDSAVCMDNGNTIYYTTDGLNFASTSLASQVESGGLMSIATNGSGIYVMMVKNLSGVQKVLTNSESGAGTWINHTPTGLTPIGNVAYFAAAGKFVVFGDVAGVATVWTSSNGAQWTRFSIDAIIEGTAFAQSTTTLIGVVANSSGTDVYNSLEGSDWTLQLIDDDPSTIVGPPPQWLCYGSDGLFYLLVLDQTNSNATVYSSSTQGVSWNIQSVSDSDNSPPYWNTLTQFTGGLLSGTDANTQKSVALSRDGGQSWTNYEVNLITVTGLLTDSYGATVYAYGGRGIQITPNGITWESGLYDTTAEVVDMASNGGLSVAVGNQSGTSGQIWVGV